MTTGRFWVAAVLFHASVLAFGLWLVARWGDPARRRSHTPVWLRMLVGDGLRFLAASGVASLLAPVLVVLPDLERVSKISATALLLGQALFWDLTLLMAVVAWRHRERPLRAALLLSGCAMLGLAYWQGYHREPRQLAVRHHTVERPGFSDWSSLRILHLTDIQTPAIGAHEERALREGLAHRPDLIVLTGDYVQNALGRRTEDRAMRDLRALMSRVGFGAPLGVFATEGDAGPPCREVFAGTHVRCLVDDSVRVGLPDGRALSLTGLSRSRGRDRSGPGLRALLGAAPASDHRIVISHAPDFVDALAGHADVDLVLAGHTHGGQVVVPFLGPLFTASRLPRRYAGGLNDYQGIPLHVSRGVGMERGFAPQVRFLCPPEICVLDLRLPARLRPPTVPSRAASAADPGSSATASAASCPAAPPRTRRGTAGAAP